MTDDKILVLKSYKDFDKFTNTYGILQMKGNKQVLVVDWARVDQDFYGFYIDKDSDLQKRYKQAFLNGKLYPSWWINEGIYGGLVYVFN